MPKISLIKHRIHQEQLRLLESQKNANYGENAFGNEPLSLVSRKKDSKEGAGQCAEGVGWDLGECFTLKWGLKGFYG